MQWLRYKMTKATFNVYKRHPLTSPFILFTSSPSCLESQGGIHWSGGNVSAEIWLWWFNDGSGHDGRGLQCKQEAASELSSHLLPPLHQRIGPIKSASATQHYPQKPCGDTAVSEIWSVSTHHNTLSWPHGLLTSAKDRSRAELPRAPRGMQGYIGGRTSGERHVNCLSLHSSPVDSPPGGSLKQGYVSQRGQLCFWFRCWKVTGGSHTLGARCWAVPMETVSWLGWGGTLYFSGGGGCCRGWLIGDSCFNIFFLADRVGESRFHTCF